MQREPTDLRYAVHIVFPDPYFAGRPGARVAVTDAAGRERWLVTPLSSSPPPGRWWLSYETAGPNAGCWCYSADPTPDPTRVRMPDSVLADLAVAAATHVEDRPPEPPAPDPVDRIERPGRRTLKVGQNVRVQPKMRKGTWTVDAVVRELFSDGTVVVADGVNVHRVTADWVHVLNSTGPRHDREGVA